MNDHVKALDDVIREVVFNDDVSQLLRTPNAAHPYDGVVKFQVDECEDNGTSIAQEGFQIGEPFDGDIENAPVLFLSSNPAFNFDEVSPRYFPDSGKIFKPEHIDAQKQGHISDGDYSFAAIQNAFTVPQREMSFDEIKEFLMTRIQTSPARNDSDQALRIPLKDGGLVAVPYWGTVRNNTEKLLPTDLTGLWANLTPSQRAREIMKYVVCMEIVPFRSTMGAGLTPALFYKCWNNFTEHLLAHSGARVIVLSGKTLFFDAFCRNVPLTDSQIQTLNDHNIVQCNFGGKTRLVVKAETAGRGAGTALIPFDRYFDPAQYPTTNSDTLPDLIQAVAGSDFVRKAISQINN